MKTLPSKELLSEVLGIKQFCNGEYLKKHCFGYPRVLMKGYPFTLNDNEEFAIRANELCYGFINTVENPHREVPDFKFINIYELAHKCKEWSLSKGYAIESCLEHKTSIAAIISVDSDNPLFGTKHYYISDTEPEAIFKACEWIMEQIK